MNAMVLLTASTIALLLSVAVMPWRTLVPSRNAGFVVTVVAGCTFMGIGFGSMTFGVLILLFSDAIANIATGGAHRHRNLPRSRHPSLTLGAAVPNAVYADFVTAKDSIGLRICPAFQCLTQLFKKS